MKKLLRAGCLSALAMLAGCGGDSSNTPSSSSRSTASTGSTGSTAPVAQQAITLTTQSAGLVQQAAPSGKGIMLQLDGRFQSAVIARRNADGSIAAECHDEQQPADAFVQGAALAPAQDGVK